MAFDLLIYLQCRGSSLHPWTWQRRQRTLWKPSLTSTKTKRRPLPQTTPSWMTPRSLKPQVEVTPQEGPCGQTLCRVVMVSHHPWIWLTTFEKTKTSESTQCSLCHHSLNRLLRLSWLLSRIRLLLSGTYHTVRPCHGAESHLAISSGAGLRAGWEPYLRLLGSKSSSGSLAPMDTIFGFGSGSAALAPWEPFHYINPLNFLCVYFTFQTILRTRFFSKIF